MCRHEEVLKLGCARFIAGQRRQVKRVAAWLLALLLIAGSASAGSTLRILYVNDLHGWLLPWTGERGREEGGVARIAALVKRLRRDGSLFVASGDLMQGTNLSNLFEGRPVIESLNLAGLQATAVGNHDFDYGLDALRARAGEADFPFLAANAGGAVTGFITDSAVVDAGDLRVGLFGLTAAETPLLTHPGNVAGVTFRPPREAAAAAVRRLEGSVDVIVCLSHLGLAADMELAAAVPGIDVIVGGHTHTLLERPVVAGGTVIVQASDRGAFVGLLDAVVEGGRVVSFEGRLLPVDGRAGEEERVASLIGRAAREAGRKLDEIVGVAAADLDGNRERVRTGATNLGSLVAEAVREAAGAETAIINGGSIRASIPAGRVSLAHLYNALPFDGHVVSFLLSGEEIVSALETGLSRLEAGGGGFPQVSGLSFTFDPGAGVGARIVEVRVGGEPLQPERVYSVATNDFLAAGGDGYQVFLGREPERVVTGRQVRDVVADYWRLRGRIPAPSAGNAGAGK